MKRLFAVGLALTGLAMPALAQQVAPAPGVSQEALQAAQALTAYQRGQAMQRNAAVKLCALGQATYCGEAQATAPASSQGNASGTTAQPPAPGGRR